uniref:Uncharacterized protein n=1 Tax=Octopus bimaculoides TaxID=37653 RepID=A0A0L8FN47_OCTBM
MPLICCFLLCVMSPNGFFSHPRQVITHLRPVSYHKGGNEPRINVIANILSCDICAMSPYLL